jgi:flagellar protein FliS
MPRPQDAYLESKILTAPPLELVRMLYGAAGDAVRKSREHLAAGRISERSREICRALAILTELTSSLDHSRGGDLSRNLAELYDYMQRRLLEANLRQKPEPLAEVQRLLATLLEGWQQIGQADAPPVMSSRNTQTAWQAEFSTGSSGYPAAALMMDVGREYATQSWTL